MNLKIKDLTALVPIVMALHKKTNSLLVGFLKIYSQGLVAASPALLFEEGLLCAIFILRTMGQMRTISLNPFPSPLAINCHEVMLLVIKNKEDALCKIPNHQL